MNALPLRPARDLRVPLSELIDSHGLRAVCLTLLRLMLQRPKRPPPVPHLPPHLLRDIGLPPDFHRPGHWSSDWQHPLR